MATRKQSRPDFISEPITPEAGAFDAAAMSRGEPGVPRAFAWRGTRYVVKAVLSKWKTSTADRGDLYLRRHWFELRTEPAALMTIYCDRQAKNTRKPKARWWLYSMTASCATHPTQIGKPRD